MRVAILAPISWPLPPSGYGPWELVAYRQAEGLVDLGFDVTVFAAGGSKTRATLVETVPYALETWPEAERRRVREFDRSTGLLEGPPDGSVLEKLHIATCMERVHRGEFDVVHSHLHIHALVYSRMMPCPVVSTLHGAAWARAHHPILDAYREQSFVSISNAERTLHTGLNYVATVYNGISLDDFPLCVEKDDYLLFAGRLSPEKGPDVAIEIAKKSGRRLILAGLIEGQYQDYFDAKVKPHIDGRQVEYRGLLSQKELSPLYQRAAGVLFPINWCEPFGLVAVEAQASGTPLIATRFGALPEIIVEGETGFVVDSVDEAVRAVGNLSRIQPQACRDNVASRFTVEAMAKGYGDVYESLLRVRS
jgi:glycosyltransferase involved in cell wall biosynthesis